MSMFDFGQHIEKTSELNYWKTVPETVYGSVALNHWRQKLNKIVKGEELASDSWIADGLQKYMTEEEKQAEDEWEVFDKGNIIEEMISEGIDPTKVVK